MTLSPLIRTKETRSLRSTPSRQAITITAVCSELEQDQQNIIETEQHSCTKNMNYMAQNGQ